MRRILIVVVLCAAVVSGCGSFQFGGSAAAPPSTPVSAQTASADDPVVASDDQVDGGADPAGESVEPTAEEADPTVGSDELAANPDELAVDAADPDAGADELAAGADELAADAADPATGADDPTAVAETPTAELPPALAGEPFPLTSYDCYTYGPPPDPPTLAESLTFVESGTYTAGEDGDEGSYIYTPASRTIEFLDGPFAGVYTGVYVPQGTRSQEYAFIALKNPDDPADPAANLTGAYILCPVP